MNCALPVLLAFVLSWAYAIRPYVFHDLVFVFCNGILCKLHIDIFCDLCYILNRTVRIKLEEEVDERC